MQGIVTKPGHPLEGKVVDLGGRSTVHRNIKERIVVQDFRYEGRWQRLEARFIERLDK